MKKVASSLLSVALVLSSVNMPVNVVAEEGKEELVNKEIVNEQLVSDTTSTFNDENNESGTTIVEDEEEEEDDSITAQGEGWILYKEGKLELTSLQDYSSDSLAPWYSYRTSITEVTLPANTTVIGAYAFYKCTKLTKINGFESVTTIKESAFEGCSALSSITLSSKIKEVGDNAFKNATGLTSLYIDDLESYLTIHFSNSYSYPMRYAYMLYVNSKLVTEVSIPESISKIDTYHFYECSNITSIEFLNKNISIASKAFYACPGLSYITINGGTIGANCFENCISLLKVTLGNSVKSIGNDAFLGDTKLHSLDIADIGSYLSIQFGNKYSYPMMLSSDPSLYIQGTIASDIVIPEGITSINAYHFNGCKSITSLTFPSTMTSISDSLFEGNTHLKSVTINGSKDTVIGQKAFASCTSLTTITINGGKVGVETFSGCNAITKVTLGNNVVSIGKDAFKDDTKIATLNITDLASYLSIDFKNEYSYPMYYAKTLQINGKNAEAIEIPEGITAIHQYHFNGCSNITSLVVAESVESIAALAFAGSTKITTVTIKGNTTIGENAFANDTGIKNIHILGGSIGKGAFSGCSSLEKIQLGKNVTAINEDAFKDDSKITILDINDLESYLSIQFGNDYSYPMYYAKTLYIQDSVARDIVIPEGITAINQYHFNGCKNINTLIVASSVKTIAASSFMGAIALTDVEIKGTTTIGDNAFANTTALKNVSIAGGSIGKGAFSGCSALEKVVLGKNVTAINEDAFKDDEALTILDIEDPTSYLAIQFANNTSYPMFYAHILYINGEQATDVVVDEGPTKVNLYHFGGCTNITSITLPESIQSVAEDAFVGCESLTAATILGGTIGNNAFSNLTNLTDVTLGNKVTKVGSGAFDSCTKLKNLSLGSGITSIGANAFKQDANLTTLNIADVKSYLSISFGNEYSYPMYYANSLKIAGELATELVIPDGIPSININHFKECENITSIVITDANTVIEESAFANLTGLTSINIYSKTINKGAFENCTALADVVLASGVVSVGENAFRGDNALKSVALAKSIKTIGNDAFNGCTALTSLYIDEIASYMKISFGNDYSYPMYYANKLYIDNQLATALVIPDGITVIKTYHFRGCTNITSLSMADSVTTIEANAFNGCIGLEKATIGNGVTSIGEQAFNVDIALKEVTLGNKVKTIGKSAFSGCTNLVDITLPDSLTAIEAGTFYGCTSLIEVIIGNGVTSIGNSAFYECSNLAIVVIGDSVRSIGNYAFYDCHNLKSITLPNGLEAIGTFAFYNANQVTSVVIPGTVTSIGNYAFMNNTALETVYIPDSVVEVGKSPFGGATPTYYLFKGSEADTNIRSGKKVYLNEATNDAYLYAKYNDYTMAVNSTMLLSDLLITTYDVYDMTVSISDPSVVSYTRASGMIKGVKSGSATIKLTYNGTTVQFTLHVGNGSAISQISFAKTSLSLTKDDKTYNVPTIAPAAYTNGTFTWTSSNENIVSVDAQGYITANKAGNATITLTAANGVSGSYKVSVTAPLKSLVIPYSSFTVVMGETESLIYYVYPSDTTDTNEVKFASADPSIATINAAGEITGVKAGSTTITVTKGACKDTVKVVVTNPISSIKLNTTSAQLENGKTLQLTATLSPASVADHYTVKWTSSNTSVATVDANGLVTSVGSGNAKITASAGTVTASCTITSPEISLKSISIGKDVTLLVGEDYDLPVTYNPTNATYSDKVTFESSNEAVAKVSSDGSIIALSYGETKITAKTTNDKLATITVKVVDMPFTDVVEGKWYYDVVAEVYSLKLMTGKTATTFAPSDNMTRAMVATVLYRMAGSPTVQYDGHFADVPAGKYYSDAVTWCYQNGIVKGKSDTRFDPSNNITRQEMAIMLRNYAGACGIDIQSNQSIASYPDSSSVSSWAKEAMQWAVENGLISGSNGYLKPKDNATRAQCAKMLLATYHLIKD